MTTTDLTFTPVTNTPQASLVRGDRYYRIYRNLGQLENSPNALLQWSFPLSVAGIAVGPNSIVDLFVLKGLDPLAGDSERSVLISPDTPYVNLSAAASQASGAGNLIIQPRRWWPSNGGGVVTNPLVDLFVYFNTPAFVPYKRYPVRWGGATGSDQVFTLGAGNGVVFDGAWNNALYGKRKMAFSGNVSSAATVRFDVFGDVLQYDSGSLSFIQASTLLFTYTTTGTAADGFNGFFDIGGDYATNIRLLVTKTAGAAGSGAMSAPLFYDN